MSDVHFFIAPVARTALGQLAIGTDVDLEETFKGLFYSSITGMNTRGKNNGIYMETFSDEEKAQVYISDNITREKTDISLKLYFFAPDETGDEEANYSAAQGVYDRFLDFIEGKRLVYHDTYRKRFVYIYLVDKTDPSKEVLYGHPYLECTFKFKNIYGKTFKQPSDIIL